MNNDRDFDKFDYEEMSKLFEEAKRERLEREQEEEYKKIRETSKRDQANAFLESLSKSRPIGPAIEPPMERKSMAEINDMPLSGETYDSTRAENLLNSLKSPKQDEFVYVEADEQPLQETRITDNEKVQKAVKMAGVILVSLGLAASAFVYGHVLHQRDNNMMEGMNEYSQFLEETGQRASEENYQYFVNHVYNQDAPQQSSGGRTNG